MKKSLSLLLFLALILNIFTVSGQIDVDLEGEAEVKNIAALDTGELELTDEVETEAKAKSSVSLCVDFLKVKFPNARPARLDTECRRLKAAALALGKDEVKTGALDKARFQKITGLSQKNRERLESLKAERLDKLEALSKDKLERLAENLNEEALLKISKLDTARLQKIADIDNTLMERLRCVDRARLKELSEKTPEEARKMLNELKCVTMKKEEFFRTREIIKAKLDDAKERYKNALEKFREAKEDVKEERQAFRDAVDSGNEEKAMEYAKSLLTRAADMVINSLEKIKANVESNDDLSDEEAAEIIADLDAKIKIISDAKAKAEAATTKEELKEAAEIIRNAWARMKHAVKLHAARVIKANVMDVMKRAEQLESRLDKVIVKLEEQGYEVSGVEDLTIDFSEKINDAREKFKTAQDKLQEARELKDSGGSQEEIETMVTEAKELVKEAHELLKEAHEILKSIVSEIKELAGTDEVLAEVEAEAEIEVAVESEVSA